MIRFLKTVRRDGWAAGVLVVALGLSGPGLAATHKLLKAKPAPRAAAPGGKPQLVGTFGDWVAYEAQSPKSKICYALAQPKDRTPAALKSAQAYIFISNRPGEHVRNEISVIMGVPLKEGSGDAKAEVGSSVFDLVTKGQNAWMKNAAQESQLIEVMKKHGKLMVKAPVMKGGMATDSYSLAGLAQALDQVKKGCP